MSKETWYNDELRDLEDKGLKRSVSVKDEKSCTNLSSNDYLGLSKHPDVIAAAEHAVRRFGTGGTSSRLLAGTLSVHRQLEESLAAFLQKDAALLFSSGYHVNTGVIPALMGAGDVIFVDRLCHATIIDGIKLSGARFHTFEHNNAEDLAALLKKNRSGKNRALIVSEGVFSMDGDIAPVARLADLSEQYDALFYLDEAHSIGVFGAQGQGVASAQNALDRVDILVGTLSKSMGSQGGFVAARKNIIDFLISRSRAFIYTTALAPACAAAGLASLQLFPSVRDRARRILEVSQALRADLTALGFSTMDSASPIVPVLVGEVARTRMLSEYLLSHGFFVPSIRPPTVPAGESRLRLSITWEIGDSDMMRLTEAFKGAGLVKTH
jgi:8-amino-7-oxononanoate synthase